MQPKVLLLEDDEFIRMSVEAALGAAGFKVVASCSTASEAIEKAQLTLPNAAVLDLHLGTGPTGIDVAKVLRRNNPAIGLVILSSYEDPRLLSTFLPQAPSGTRYLVKKDVKSLDQLASEIHLALNRSKVSPKTNSTLSNLTDVQIETLKLVANGFSNAEIAKRRSVNEKAIEATLSRVAKALDLELDKSQNQRVNIARFYFEAIGVGVASQK
jgi:two-component system, NarL family, nitrate/nitrite response regulator NarL